VVGALKTAKHESQEKKTVDLRKKRRTKGMLWPGRKVFFKERERTRGPRKQNLRKEKVFTGTNKKQQRKLTKRRGSNEPEGKRESLSLKGKRI